MRRTKFARNCKGAVLPRKKSNSSFVFFEPMKAAESSLYTQPINGNKLELIFRNKLIKIRMLYY